MGAAIGKTCVTDDGEPIGTVVCLDRDRRGRPEWIDVVLEDAVRRDRSIEPERVRFSAGLVDDWTGDDVALSLGLEALRSRWSPSQPVQIEEPVL